MEKSTDPFVVALDTTFPDPHCNCTSAFGKTGAVVLALREQRRVPSMRIKPSRPLMSPSWASATGAAAMAAKIKETKRRDLKAIANSFLVSD